MTNTRTIALMATLTLAPLVNAAAAVSSVEVLDARIADAEHAATTAQKAADTICHNAGFANGQRELGLPSNASEQLKQCSEAVQANSDAIGFVGFLYEERSRLTGQSLSARYACSGKPSLGAPHPDAKGHYTVCPNDADNHSYKFWIITQVRMQVGSAKETWSDGGIISMGRYKGETECRAAIAKYEDYPSNGW
jgi:hypothetical protein